MYNFKITLEYDGTGFHGWQIQPNLRTVQGELKKVLETLFQQEINITGAGRTDAGVHALGQVASFHTNKERTLYEIKKGLNALLPLDVRVLNAESVPLDFSARFSAKSRTYRYIISYKESALKRNYVWFVPYSLDISKMREFYNFLIGRQEFQSFCSSDTDTEGYWVDVKSFKLYEENSELIFEIKADRFLHHMVRIIVGTAVDISRGRLPYESINNIIKDKDRTRAGITAPPQGLYFVSVEY
jgi:tRNA pseudouridine38-40 synthase